MLKKLNLSYKGTIFTYAWFLFTIYCSYLILSSNGIKTISLKIGNVGFGILFNETFVAIMLLVIYLLFSMIPSRRGMLLPNTFLMFSVGQSVFYCISSLVRFDLLSLVISILYAVSFIGIMYAYNLICFDILDNSDGQGSYMYRWTAAMRNSIIKYWQYAVIFILLHAFLTSIILINYHK